MLELSVLIIAINILLSLLLFYKLLNNQNKMSLLLVYADVKCQYFQSVDLCKQTCSSFVLRLTKSLCGCYKNPVRFLKVLFPVY